MVTGSSKGIGYTLARGLARAGARVVLNGRDGAAVDRARDALGTKGLGILTSPFDATDAAAVPRAVETIETEVGPIDILINNAGMQFRTPLEDFPAEAWHPLLATWSMIPKSRHGLSDDIMLYLIRVDHVHVSGSVRSRDIVT